MDRRRDERRIKRIPVRFRERGAAGARGEPRRGYATNISAGGMYIATGTPSTSRTRLRIEIGEPPDDFAVEGVVAHSKRLAPELRMLGLAGMGIRFLPVQELVSELLGGGDAGLGGAGAEPDEAEEEEGVYRLRFDSPEQFSRVARNDVVHGGLFVPTRRPAPLDRPVIVEVELPVAGLCPVRLAARVVQRIEPDDAGGKPNLLAGMGVQLDDPEAAHKAFRPALEALEGRRAT
jgi:Tfp pilus assembly protein PilZ